MDSLAVAAALLEAGDGRAKEMRHLGRRTAHNMSSSSLRKKSDTSLVRKVPCASLRPFLSTLQEVLLGTRLSLLFPAVALAVFARYMRFGQVRSFSVQPIYISSFA
jgi:Ca2+:H+ antiporter